MPSRDIKDCVPILQEIWSQASQIYNEKYPDEPYVFLTCTHRTNAEQKELYAKGRTKPGGIVTYIKENGKHNSYPAKAFDVAFQKNKKCDWNKIHFMRFAKIVKELTDEVKWGGDWKRFKDMPHFEV
jgi:peptidoglycan L-alanyl-D-glutamate endopeptidase CwlK